jgi:hypothetical protein
VLAALLVRLKKAILPFRGGKVGVAAVRRRDHGFNCLQQPKAEKYERRNK